MARTAPIAGHRVHERRLAANEMSLDAVRQAYYEATGKASDIARQLSFAGIAIVWVLSGQNLTKTGGIEIKSDLLWVSALLVLAMALDLLQYTSRSIIWGRFGRVLERRDQFRASAPRWFNRVALWFFGLKIGAAVLAYVLLLIAVLRRVL